MEWMRADRAEDGHMANGDNGNGRDPMSGFPWWVKAVVVVGVPSAIALGLVWSDRAQLSDAVYYNKAVLSGMVVTDTAHDLRVTEKFNELSRQTQETNRILMAGCVNDAKTENERNRCLGR